MNSKSLALVLAATAASLCIGAQAADGTTTTTTSSTTTTIVGGSADAGGLSKSEAKDLQNHSTADYKARKKIADAQLDENKADCKTLATGAVGRACKGDAKAQAKKDKADAKVIHEAEKADIKSSTAQ